METKKENKKEFFKVIDYVMTKVFRFKTIDETKREIEKAILEGTQKAIDNHKPLIDWDEYPTLKRTETLCKKTK